LRTTPALRYLGGYHGHQGADVVWRILVEDAQELTSTELRELRVARRRTRQQKQHSANKFESEIEIFQVEEAAAQQYFFGYLTVTKMASKDSEFLQLVLCIHGFGLPRTTRCLWRRS
jgi:hypothetical protein